MTATAYRRELGELLAGMTTVAAKNPHGAFQPPQDLIGQCALLGLELLHRTEIGENQVQVGAHPIEPILKGRTMNLPSQFLLPPRNQFRNDTPEGQ